MATKKVPANQTPGTKEFSRERQAMICGCLSGMQDHIVKLMQELTDISGRCALSTEINEKAELLTKEELAFMEEVKKFVETRFGNLLDLTDKLRVINTRLNKQQPQAT